MNLHSWWCGWGYVQEASGRRGKLIQLIINNNNNNKNRTRRSILKWTLPILLLRGGSRSSLADNLSNACDGSGIGTSEVEMGWERTCSLFGVPSIPQLLQCDFWSSGKQFNYYSSSSRSIQRRPLFSVFLARPSIRTSSCKLALTCSKGLLLFEEHHRIQWICTCPLSETQSKSHFISLYFHSELKRDGGGGGLHILWDPATTTKRRPWSLAVGW